MHIEIVNLKPVTPTTILLLKLGLASKLGLAVVIYIRVVRETLESVRQFMHSIFRFFDDI